MKFLYEYRTSDNVRHADVVTASSREAVFQLLKARGIKPSRVVEASGFFNKLFGKGKRWIAITVLVAVVIGLVSSVLKLRNEIDSSQLEESFEDRSQIYGDPVVLGEMFSNNFEHIFENQGEAFLARYAIPGKVVRLSSREVKSGIEALKVMPAALVKIKEDDFAEVAKLKRIVNGMKMELEEYLKAGGAIPIYVKRLQRRQNDEVMTYQRVKTELERVKDPCIWKDRNIELRVLGLPMVEMPPEENMKPPY